MKNRQSRLVFYLPGILILTLAAVILRCLGLILDFDYISGYYVNGVFSAIADWLTVASLIGSLSYLIFGDKGCGLVASYDGAATFIPSLTVGSALLFITVSLGASLGSQDGRHTVVAIANIIALVLSAVGAYAFFITAYRTSRKDSSRASVQIGALLFFAVYAAYIYFDNPLPINAPNRVVDITAYLFFAVFFIYETRISLGRDMWRAYTAFGLCAVTATAYSAIPSMVVYFSRGVVISHSIYETVLTLSLFLFVIMRLVRSLSLFEDVEADVVKAIRFSEQKRAELRAEEINGNVLDAEDSSDGGENYTFELGQTDENNKKEAEQ